MQCKAEENKDRQGNDTEAIEDILSSDKNCCMLFKKEGGDDIEKKFLFLPSIGFRPSLERVLRRRDLCPMSFFA